MAAEVARAEIGRPPVASVHAVSGLGARLDANPVEAGENVARLLVILEPGAGRAGEAEAMERMRAGLATRAGVEAEFTRPALFDLARPLEVELVGSDTERLREASQRLMARMAATGRFSDLRASIDRGQPEVSIEFDQERLAALGLTSRQVADQVVRAVRGEVATRLRNEDRRIDIVVRLPAERRAALADLERLPVPGSARPVRLAEVARLRIDESPAEIRRVDQQRVAVVAAQYRHRDLASALAELRLLLAEPLAPAVSARLGAQSAELGVSRDSLVFTLALAVFLVYLVMAAQFESLLHPFVILLTVPLALIGVVLSLALVGLPLSAMAMIGLILLAGIVVNNAIVLIDRINQLRIEGSARRAAILRAAEERLRPILMTTLTTVLGFLPMALAGGEGAELRRPLAVAVVGGLSVATLLTLFVIPALYELLDRKSAEAFARLRAGAEAGA
ncbi:MAG: efflux RND transporter permease subunit [Xanthomonadales bacterium]|nr:efflux RND transporter permease subunit [Xanthomonadales bacterium]